MESLERVYGRLPEIQGRNLAVTVFDVPYSATSLVGKRTFLGPYRRPMPRDLGGS